MEGLVTPVPGDSQTTEACPLFLDAYSANRVLVTGHTGFKGSWLVSWLLELGADVTGYALDPPTTPSAFELCKLAGRIDHRVLDVRDASALARVVEQVKPAFIFHMAAQSLVRPSYESPVETFDTNVMGTVNVLEAVRRAGRPCVVVVVTSDKCYRNAGSRTRYAETDPMGGRDPYSASKGCAELAVSAYRRSFFPVNRHSEHGVAVASVRAGNVIGGGDWARDRLVPDIVRALAEGNPANIRNPGAVRPWQHVLDPLSGYLWLGARMSAEGAGGLAEAWNFGPDRESAVTVRELADRVVRAWGEGSWESSAESDAPHEAAFLELCCDKAAERLGWRSVYDLDAAVEATVAWHKRAESEGEMLAFTAGQIRDYVARARASKVAWAGPATGAGEP